MNQYSVPRAARRNSAFTLVEIMVALAIMMLLLAIILVPVNMALNVFHIGKARNEVKAADQVVLNQLNAELRQAVYVFPNEKMPGITDKAPYSNYAAYGQQPYVQLNVANLYADPNFDTGVCSVSTQTPMSNVSRLDFLLPRLQNGAVMNPVHPEYYLVTYYARRLKPLQDDGVTDNPYDAYSNPIVLFRAQVPYRYSTGADFTVATPVASTLNANLLSVSANGNGPRYPDPSTLTGLCLSSTTTKRRANRGSVWLTQNQNGEPNLELLCTDAAVSGTVVAGSHTLITPRDMGLVAPNATATPTPNYQPDSSFTCDDSDGDGKIDRVTINLNMAKYDAIGAQTTSQQVRLSQTVDLPNVK